MRAVDTARWRERHPDKAHESRDREAIRQRALRRLGRMYPDVLEQLIEEEQVLGRHRAG